MIGEKNGKKINCRSANQCIFCNYWQGKSAKINYRNGESTYDDGEGMCSKTNTYQSPDNYCRYFQRKLMYL